MVQRARRRADMDGWVVDPTRQAGGRGPGSRGLAPRELTSLDGKVVGLLDSTKANSNHFLASVGKLLGERYEVAEVIYETKPYFGNPVPADQAASLAARCDVVVTGVGD